MVSKASGYFELLLKGYQSITQGNPLSPTIFNVAVEAVIRNWVMLVTPTEAGTGGIGLTIIDLEANFFADDGLVASTQTERLKREFDVLTGFFNRVGL